MNFQWDVSVVGAGPAGLGCAIALRACGARVLVVDSVGVGASFVRWPRQMRFLTPSFHSNAFGSVDLNAVTPETSPADFLHTQHPDGVEYARYLQALVVHYQIEVEAPRRVTGLRVMGEEGFVVETDGGERRARFVIWAVGEFSRPDWGGILGADFGLHTSEVKDWDELVLGRERFAVVGGYESGMDAAIQLMQRGMDVHVLSRGEPWSVDDADPSKALSPSTRDRLRRVLLESDWQVAFYKNANITEIQREGEGFVLLDDEGTPFRCETRPLLATGFQSALMHPVMEGLWDWKAGQPVLSETADESTRTPGLFYSGPSLQQRGMLFCFVYKFRARFGVIAREIAGRLGLEWEEPLGLWRERGFMLDDLSCCTDCQCAVEAEVDDEQPEVLDYAEVAEK
jgi:thioredoxin reductase